MAGIANAVRKIIGRKPFIQEALGRGIINNAALADEIMPQIEKELGHEIKFSAANMAIRRLQEKLGSVSFEKARFDRGSDITVKSSLIEITIFKIEDVQEQLKKLYDIIDYRKGDFLTITQGIHEVMLITNAKFEKQILAMFPKKIVKKEIKGLSSLTISIPSTAHQTVGVFYLATRALSWESINIVDIVSTYTEMTFIIREEDTARAFNVLSELIKLNAGSN